MIDTIVVYVVWFVWALLVNKLLTYWLKRRSVRRIDTSAVWPAWVDDQVWQCGGSRCATRNSWQRTQCVNCHRMRLDAYDLPEITHEDRLAEWDRQFAVDMAHKYVTVDRWRELEVRWQTMTAGEMLVYLNGVEQRHADALMQDIVQRNR